MGRDEIASMQLELRQFVMQAQNRLDGLRKSLNKLRQAAKEAAPESVLVDGDSNFIASSELAKSHKEVVCATEATRPQRPTVTEGAISEMTRSTEPDFDQTAVNGASGVADRLEAIKRRLAQQIENA